MSDSGTPPPGWYPAGDGGEVWWDGVGWTEHRRPAGSADGPSTPTGWPSIVTSEPAAYVDAGGGGAAPQGPGMSGQPPVPHGPRPPRSSRSIWLLVAITAVLVLVIGTGVTLAVTQPWRTDTSADPDDDPTDDSSGGSEDGGARAARSDFDGDGRGDVIGVFFDGEVFAAVTLTAGDGEFAVSEAPAGYEGHLIWEDWDGDGTATALRWTFSAYDEKLEIKAESGDFPSQAWSGLGLWAESLYLRVDSGDVDGDGLGDLIVLGQTKSLQVTIWVVRGTDDGFGDPEEWYVLDNTTLGATHAFPGDRDGDGATDLVLMLPADGKSIPKDRRRLDGYFGHTTMQALLSTGDGFEAADNEPGSSPFDDAVAFPRRYAIGDFRGDGSVLVALADPTFRTDDILFFEYVDGTFTRADLRVKASGPLSGLTAADVNGDGRDDLVAGVTDQRGGAKPTKLFVEVMLAEGDAMAEPAVWAELPCGDSCHVEFDSPMS